MGVFHYAFANKLCLNFALFRKQHSLFFKLGGICYRLQRKAAIINDFLTVGNTLVERLHKGIFDFVFRQASVLQPNPSPDLLPWQWLH